MSGRNAPRSKNGCSTCRRRKVKCGEERPVCQRCANLSVHCEWGMPVKRSHAVQRRELQPVRPRPTHPEKINLDYSTLERLWRDYGASRLMGSSDSFRPAALPFLPHYADPSLSPLCAPVSVPEVACANSLVLSKQDQMYFQYFPSSSIVFYYMKSWPWSSFSYLYQGPAATNNVIMRMIMAVSAGDVHRHELEIRSPGRPTAEDYARYHYGLAVKEFRQMLETPRQDVSRSTLEMIFLAMFLLIMYEWQFGNVRNLQLHLRGVRSLLEMHPELFQDRGVNSVFSLMDVDESDQALPKLSLAPVQMLLWILYVDIEAQPMGLSDSLYDYVLHSGNPYLHPDHLHQCARLWGRCFWGEQYPDQEVMDDNENYRGLELIHVGMVLRHAIWKLAVGNPVVPETSADSLFEEMVRIRNRYSDLFVTAKMARGTQAYRTITTIHLAVAYFCAHVLFHRRVLCTDRPPSALHRQAIGQIVEIVHKQYSWAPRLVQRFQWPLLMAVIDTDDCVHRDWIRQRLEEISGCHSAFAWASRVANEVLAQQDQNGEYVDLAEVLRSHVQ